MILVALLLMLLIVSCTIVFVFLWPKRKESFTSSETVTAACNDILAKPFVAAAAVVAAAASTTGGEPALLFSGIRDFSLINVDSTSSNDYAVFNELNNWRKSKGLSAYRYSPLLSAVAQFHVKYFPDNCMNWSSMGTSYNNHGWGCFNNDPQCLKVLTPCCYDPNNAATYPCMLNKVKEISGGTNTASGYECLTFGPNTWSIPTLLHTMDDPAHMPTIMSTSHTTCGCGFNVNGSETEISCWFQ